MHKNQALAALLFLYHDVLAISLERSARFVRAQRPEGLPVVLTAHEVASLLDHLTGPSRLMASLLYGFGLRLLDAHVCASKPSTFSGASLRIHDGKGRKDRVTPLPGTLIAPFRENLRIVRLQHGNDLRGGGGYIELPNALSLKYPGAPREWIWQWVFPVTRTYLHIATGQRRRHTFTKPSCSGPFAKPPSPPSSSSASPVTRCSFATHLLEDGQDIRTIQELLGHRDLSIAISTIHVPNRGVTSPLARLNKR